MLVRELVGVEVYSPAENAWHVGVISHGPGLLDFEGVHSSAAVQMTNDYFYLFGGHVHYRGNGSEYSRDVYRYDESGLSIVTEDVIGTPREFHIAAALR